MLAAQKKVPVEQDPQQCLRDGRCVAILKPDSSFSGVVDGESWKKASGGSTKMAS